MLALVFIKANMFSRTVETNVLNNLDKINQYLKQSILKIMNTLFSSQILI